jgi:hypothetical protein
MAGKTVVKRCRPGPQDQKVGARFLSIGILVEIQIFPFASQQVRRLSKLPHSQGGNMEHADLLTELHRRRSATAQAACGRWKLNLNSSRESTQWRNRSILVSQERLKAAPTRRLIFFCLLWQLQNVNTLMMESTTAVWLARSP